MTPRRDDSRPTAWGDRSMPCGGSRTGSSLFRFIPTALAFVSLLAVCLPEPLPAESLWGMEGIGRPLEGYDIAARGAGWTAIGVDGPFQMSSINPAQCAWARLPQAHFGGATERLYLKTADGGTGRLGFSALSGARVVVPGPGPLTFAAGVRDLTDASYRSTFRLNQGRDDSFERTLTGTGGLNEVSADVAARLWQDRMALGLHFGFASGSLRDVADDRFDSQDFRGTHRVVQSRLSGGRPWAAGFQARAHTDLSLGAVYFGSTTLDIEEKALEPAQSKQNARLDYPSGFGLGLAWRLPGGRVRVSGDWMQRAWGQVDFRSLGGTWLKDMSAAQQTPTRFGVTQDIRRLGLGLTFLPGARTAKDPLFKRAVWRAGFTWGQLPVRQNDGAAVSEWTATGGLGLPILFDRGFIDGLVEYGQRGSLDPVGLRERYLRVGLGVTFGRFESKF